MSCYTWLWLATILLTGGNFWLPPCLERQVAFCGHCLFLCVHSWFLYSLSPDPVGCNHVDIGTGTNLFQDPYFGICFCGAQLMSSSFLSWSVCHYISSLSLTYVWPRSFPTGKSDICPGRFGTLGTPRRLDIYGFCLMNAYPTFFCPMNACPTFFWPSFVILDICVEVYIHIGLIKYWETLAKDMQRVIPHLLSLFSMPRA